MSLFSFPEQVNERAARTVAAVVMVLALVGAVSGVPAVTWVLCVGFFLRVGWGPRVSPLARAAVWLAAKWWAPVPVPGRPKRFAQGVGAGLTLAAGVLQWAGHGTAAQALLGVLVACAGMESVLGFCLGCWAFGKLQRLGWISPDACVACANLEWNGEPRAGVSGAVDG